MIALVDYGAGNLRSVEKALAASGAEVRLAGSPQDILAADKVVLPGVGAFADCMAGLQQRGLTAALRQAVAENRPFLGICVGMQLLFETGEEMGRHAGLGLLAGRVPRFPVGSLKTPQTGWNQIFFDRTHPLLSGLETGCYVYFNHSYYCAPADAGVTLAQTTYGLTYASMVARGRLYGVQFHPEKSQAVGLRILRNFVEQG